jgi:hypothetical protein
MTKPKPLIIRLRGLFTRTQDKPAIPEVLAALRRNDTRTR